MVTEFHCLKSSREYLDIQEQEETKWDERGWLQFTRLFLKQYSYQVKIGKSLNSH